MTLFNIIRIILLAGVLSMTAGCAQYQRIQSWSYGSLMRLVKLDAPEKFAGGSQQTVAADSSARSFAWWQELHNDQLDSLLAEVLAHNPDIEQAAARYRQAASLAEQAGAAVMPSLSLIGRSDRTHYPGQGSGFTGDNYKLSTAASYELDLWGRIDAEKSAARFSKLASQDDLYTVMIGVTAQAADLYFMAVEQRGQLVLARRMAAAYDDLVERVNRRYQAGLTTSADVYQARQNLLAAQIKIPAYESSLGKANHALAVLAGAFPDNDDRFTAGKGTDMESAPAGGDLDIAWPAGPLLVPAQLLENRPDIRAAYLRLQALDAKTAAAVADRFPSVKISASLGRAQIDSILGAAIGLAWNVAADASQSIFDGGRRRAEVDKNKAAFQEALAHYRQVVLRSFQEVDDALLQIDTSRRQLRFLEKRTVETEAARRLANDRYAAGLADYIPVVSAELANFAAQSQVLAARRQLISERISLIRAVSGRPQM